MIKFSSREFIFMRSSFSLFILFGGWYDADCGADCGTGCVGYGMDTIGATGCVGYVCDARYGCGCGWRF